MVALANAIRILRRGKKDHVMGKVRKGADNNHSKRGKERPVRTHLRMPERVRPLNRGRARVVRKRVVMSKAVRVNSRLDNRGRSRAREVVRVRRILLRTIQVKERVARHLRLLHNSRKQVHRLLRMVEEVVLVPRSRRSWTD